MNPQIQFWSIGANGAALSSILDQFQAEQHIDVRVRHLGWDTAWAELMRAALHQQGPDLAEIGSTWLSDLVSMNALHPLSDHDLNHIGQAWSWLYSAWQSTHLLGEEETWATPWVTEARLLFYRRSWIERAGLDPRVAFRTPEAFEQALATLQASRVPIPLIIPTRLTYSVLHNAASWIWSADGTLVTPDGEHVAFNSDRARAGLRTYFSLGRYLAPSVHLLDSEQFEQRFVADPNAAITLTGPWLLVQNNPALRAELEMSMPPVPSFVGGSHLVIWKNSKRVPQALKLIQHLTRTTVQVEYSERIGHLPAQLSALASAPFSTDPGWQAAAHALRVGRSFPAARAWGMIEDRLTTEFAGIWHQVLTNPELDLDALLKERMDRLAEQIEPLLTTPPTD